MLKHQFWQLWCLQNLPNLATDNVCQFWQLMILANFGNFGVFKNFGKRWLPKFAKFGNRRLPISATFVTSKCANFGNLQNLPNLSTDDICQSLKQTTFANYGNWWYVLANFGNRQHLPILATDNICQFWLLMTLANFAILDIDDIS